MSHHASYRLTWDSTIGEFHCNGALKPDSRKGSGLYLYLAEFSSLDWRYNRFRFFSTNMDSAEIRLTFFWKFEPRLEFGLEDNEKLTTTIICML